MRFVSVAVALVAAGLCSPAIAAEIIDRRQVSPELVAIIPGQCDSLTDGDSAGCSFTGNINTNTNGNASFLLAQAAYNAVYDPNIALNPLFSADSSEFILGGTQFIANGGGSFTFNLPDNLDLQFFAIKGSDEFTLYEFVGGLDNSLTFERGNLSHVVFFGTGGVPTPFGAIPEPGTWAMMLLGFGAIGFSLRRRKAKAGATLAVSLPQVINVETGHLSRAQNLLTNR